MVLQAKKKTFTSLAAHPKNGVLMCPVIITKLAMKNPPFSNDLKWDFPIFLWDFPIFHHGFLWDFHCSNRADRRASAFAISPGVFTPCSSHFNGRIPISVSPWKRVSAFKKKTCVIHIYN